MKVYINNFNHYSNQFGMYTSKAVISTGFTALDVYRRFYITTIFK